MPQQGMTLRADLKLAPASQHRLHATVAAATVLCQTRRRWWQHWSAHWQARWFERQGHRRGVEAVPVVRPLPSRNVVIPLASMVAVPVVRPVPSRNVLVPLLSVVTVPVMRPLASRNVVEGCADAVVAANMRNTSAAITASVRTPEGEAVRAIRIQEAAAPNRAARSSPTAHTARSIRTAGGRRVSA